MKVLAYMKRYLEDAGKVYTKSLEIEEERKTYPDRYPQPLSPSYMTGEELVRIYEGTEEQLANLMVRWSPEMSMKFVVVFDTSQSGDVAKRIGLLDAPTGLWKEIADAMKQAGQ